LKGLIWVLKEGATWRSLDLPGVAWQTVFGYHRKWAKSGFWNKLWETLDLPPDDGVRQVDSSCSKVHKDGANPAGGQAQQALGRTKGGLNTKFHFAVDGRGVPRALVLTAGQVNDCTQAISVLEQSGKFRLAIMDKAYDTNEIRAFLTEVEAVACIPSKANRKQVIEHDRFDYRSRHKIENFFEKIKRTRRTATRYDKTDSSFLAFLLLSMTCLFLRKQF
jgi:transposase